MKKHTRFTILGGSGFIGSFLNKYLLEKGFDCHTLYRHDKINPTQNAGHLIYCIGLTADFRNRLWDTVEAHVTYLQYILKNCSFNSLTYLSSTRIYQRSASTEEDSFLTVNPSDPSNLYNISKIMGESACLNSDHPNIKIIRLSNVVSIDKTSSNFFNQLIDSAQRGRIELATTLDSEKDYILAEDVVKGITKIILHGSHSIYNLATGKNISNLQLIERLQALTQCNYSVINTAKKTYFPPISVERIKKELDFNCESVLDAIHRYIN